MLSLAPLTDHESSALIASLATGTLENEERDLLLATAEGNPFFLEQLVASRAESGRAPVSPPPTIQALLAARIDALPATEREVVDRAAIEGRQLPSQRARSSASGFCANHLDGSYSAGTTRPHPTGRQRAARRDCLPVRAHPRARRRLRASAKARRAEFHEAYASWLEERPGGTYPELVGYHLEQAYRCHSELHPGAGARLLGLARRAARSLGTAGHAAIDRGDLLGGVNLLTRAIALIPDDEPARGTMLPELGIALAQLGRLAEAEGILTAAADRAHAAGERLAEAHAVTARFFARVQAAPEQAVTELDARFEELQRTFSAARDELGLARLWRAQALVHWLAGQSTRQRARGSALSPALERLATSRARPKPNAGWLRLPAKDRRRPGSDPAL